MSLETKIRLANCICVISFVLGVVLVFIYPHYSNIPFVLGIASGYRAATWKKRLRSEIPSKTEQGQPPKISQSTGLWITALTLPLYVLLTLALFWLGSSRFYTVHLFNTIGVKTEGNIVSLFQSGGMRMRSYWTVFNYSDGNGTIHQVQSSIDTRSWYDLKNSRFIPITYLPQKPWIYRIALPNDEQDEKGAAFFMLVLGIAFAIWGVWAYSFYFRKFLKPAAPLSP